MADEHSDDRLQPCYLLRKYGTPCVVWFEDAAAEYGVPTVLFDLYILVPDMNTAAETLIQEGWTVVRQQQGKIGNATVNRPQIRLEPPLRQRGQTSQTTAGLATTVLLPAADFNYKLTEKDSDLDSWTTSCPSLAGLVDALIDSMLDCSFEDDLQGWFSLHLAYLYGHAPELKDSAFAEQLVYEHRQYHLDVRAGMSTGTLPFIAHQRNVREAFRQRTQELQKCSAARDNESLFNGPEQARLLANMPSPFPKTEEMKGAQEPQNPSPEAIRAACAKIAASLCKTKYAILGGAACQLLGSDRTTADVDFVVPKGMVNTARALLAADKDHFTVEKRTLHTHYKSTPPMQIDILCPPRMFREAFDANTLTYAINIDGSMVEVLHPALILNAKCRSILDRSGEDKKGSDAQDIRFLLKWLADHQMFPPPEQISNASEAFVAWFIAEYGHSKLWRALE